MNEPLGFPLWHVEKQSDECEEPDVGLRVVKRFSNLSVIDLLQISVPFVDNRGVEFQLSSPDQSLVVAVPIPLI